MKRTDFAYELPDELIAQEPRERGRSRMLVVTPPDRYRARHLREFPVAPRRPRRARHQRHARDSRAALRAAEGADAESDRVPAHARARSGDVGDVVPSGEAREAGRRGDVLRRAVAPRSSRKRKGRSSSASSATSREIERLGIPPLPPYIAARRAARERPARRTRPSTPRRAAPIAAPTAGLHFTQEILDAIAARGIEIVRVTLHVGIGTFKPVKVDDIAEHRMDSERYDITAEAADRAECARSRRSGRSSPSARPACARSRARSARATDASSPATRETSIFITPGFEFRAVDRLLTNFHLPESTLLMLVSAFAGMQTIRDAYAEAIRERYLFYSYGDSHVHHLDANRTNRTIGHIGPMSLRPIASY